jgi:hypothetical protein
MVSGSRGNYEVFLLLVDLQRKSKPGFDGPSAAMRPLLNATSPAIEPAARIEDAAVGQNQIMHRPPFPRRLAPSGRSPSSWRWPLIVSWTTVTSVALILPAAVSFFAAAAAVALVGSTYSPWPARLRTAATISSSVAVTVAPFDRRIASKICLMRTGLLIAVPSAMVGLVSTGTVVRPGHEACVDRCAIRGLGAEEAWPFGNLTGGKQFREADIASENVATRARRNHDVVGRPEPEILPQLVGQQLRPLKKKGLPIVTRVKNLVRLSDRFFFGSLSRSRDKLHTRTESGSDRHRACVSG